MSSSWLPLWRCLLLTLSLAGLASPAKGATFTDRYAVVGLVERPGDSESAFEGDLSRSPELPVGVVPHLPIIAQQVVERSKLHYVHRLVL